MVSSYQVIGKPVTRIDGPDKVTGKARYAADIDLPGLLWGKSLLSPYAHARILRIDASEARKLPGVHAVLTGEDTRGHLFGRALKDIPVLADGVVRYVGDRVAAVAADDEDTAQRAVDLIEVEYEELPAVFTPEEAMAADAPILHPDYNSYTGVRQKLDAPSNAYFHTTFENGDVEAGFAASDFVFENTYHLQRQHHAFMEPQAVVVSADDGSGLVQIWTCNKVPYLLREALTHTFKLPAEQILLHHTFIGGDFGGKSAPASLPIAFFLSKATGRPVKMVHDYVEEFLAGNPRGAMTYILKTGVKRDGAILAHQITQLSNSGAYAGYKPGGVIGAAALAAGPYKMESVKIDSYNVYTNTVATQIMRAPGDPEAVFAIESQIDEVARGIGMEPVEFRLKNLIESGEANGVGEHLEAVRVKEAVRAAAQAAGYDRPKAPNVGRGIAVGERGAGGGAAHCVVTLRPDGSAVLGTAVFDQGTGTYTTLRQVVAEELRIPVESIGVEVWDTDKVDWDAGVAGSRQTRIATIVAYEAAQDTKKELVRYVAAQMGWPEENLSLRGDEVWRTDIEESVNWPDLLREKGDSVRGEAHVNENAPVHMRGWAAQVAEVSVDPETGEVKLLNFTAAYDTGVVVNPIGYEGQVNGGFMQGLGYALMEEMLVEDGRVTNVSFGDYKIPTMQDIPPLQTVLLESNEGIGPYNVRGIGELPCIPVAPAIANAVADACGVRIRELPVTAQKVYEALKRRA